MAAIPVSADDILTTRVPNHLEARRLTTEPPGKPVIEIRFPNTIVVEGDRSINPSRRH
ncbi:MAG: hypothetical protein IRY92_07255 [Dactylosporangium sp.]|nr:hypothetical protein [Dactylosporangium sp.]